MLLLSNDYDYARLLSKVDYRVFLNCVLHNLRFELNFNCLKIDEVLSSGSTKSHKSMAATARKAGKVWSLPRFWISIHSYKKQPVKKFGGRILDLALLKFAVAALHNVKSTVKMSICVVFLENINFKTSKTSNAKLHIVFASGANVKQI